METHPDIGENKKKTRAYSMSSFWILVSLIFAITFTFGNLYDEKSLGLILTISLITSALTTKLGLNKLEKFKINQIIRKEGPKKHFEKRDTPTMGGLFVIPTMIFIGNIITINSSYKEQIIGISFITLMFMFIGIVDDFNSLKKKKNEGLSPKNKILLQSLASSLFLAWAGIHKLINPEILVWGNIKIYIGILIWPLALFVLIAESNATNLTDGLDGLATGCGALVFAGLSIQLLLKENPIDLTTAKFCIAMSGSWLGFLIYNKYPAKIFMGDTGSLAMGAALGSTAIISNNLWALLIMGGLFVAESISVIIQVGIFKITKFLYQKGHRVFLMAPIHHHFELQGVSEPVIVRNSWILTFCLITLSILIGYLT